MTRPTPAPSAPDGSPRQGTLAGVSAALMPLVALALGGTFFVTVLLGGASRLRELGHFGWLTVAVATCSALSLAILLFLTVGRAWRVPISVCLGVALLPLAPAAAGVPLAISSMRGALAQVGLSHASGPAAMGGSEALQLVVLGVWLSAGLVGGVGLGLAIAAWACRASGRRLLPALPVAFLGLCAVVVPWVMFSQEDWRLRALLLPATAPGALALVLAASGVGTDERSGPRAVGAALSVLFAALLTGAARHASAVSEGLRAFAQADAAERTPRIGGAIAEANASVSNQYVAGVALALALLVVVVLARRVRGSKARLVAGAVAAAIVCAVGLALPASLEAYVQGVIEPYAHQPWDGRSEFRVASGGGLDVDLPPVALVGLEEVTPFDGEPVVSSDEAAITALFGRLRDAGPARWPGQPEGDAFEAAVGDVGGDGAGVTVTQTLRLVLDARLDAATLERVFRAAEASGYQEVVLSGQASFTAQDLRFVGAEQLLGRLLLGPPLAERVLMMNALSEGYRDRDRARWRGDVGGGQRLELTSRSDRTVSVSTDRAYGDYSDNPSLADRLLEGRDRPIAYLRIGPTATSTRLLEVANRARFLGARPLFVFRDIPGG